MALDQETTSAAGRLPTGWAYGKNSIKAHWFDAGHITSICGRSANSNLQRRERSAVPADCSECKRRLERRSQGNTDD